MRLHRIHLRDFRGVEDSEVRFSTTGVTIIEGPNEVGKTSIAEALMLLLEYPDSSDDKTVRAVRPVHADVGPWVEAEITAGPYHFVYEKRWARQPQTKLTVLAPAPDNFTSRAAHDRVRDILNETIDESLFKALRYEQGKSIAQASVGESSSLATALDAAAGGASLSDAEGDTLWEKVKKERDRYFTPGGKMNVDRARDHADLEAKRYEAGKIAEELQALDASAERLREIGGLLAANARKQKAQAVEVEELRAAAERISGLEGKSRELGLAAETTSARLEQAQDAVKSRAELRDAAARAEDALARLQDEAARETPGLGASRDAVVRAIAARDTARRLREEAEGNKALADADHAHFRDVLDLETLGERYERAATRQKELGEATAFLESCRIDDDHLERIEASAGAETEARARSGVGGASVVVEALQAVQVQLGDEAAELAAGSTIERTVSGDVLVTIGDVARVTVAADAARRELVRKAEDAAKELASMFAAFGITGDDPLAQARAQARKRRDAETTAVTAQKALEESLRDLTLDLLREKLERARERVERYAAHRPEGTPRPANIEEARQLAERAATAAEEARVADDAHQAALEQAETLAKATEAANTARSVLLTVATDNAAAAAADLKAAQDERPEDALTAFQLAAREAAATAGTNHAAACAALAAADPETTATRLRNAEAVAERLRTSHRELSDEDVRITALLEVKGQAGLADRLAERESAVVQLERKTTLNDRLAAAAELLHERLAFHRNEARKSYVAPLKREIERLARIVFRDDVTIEINHETLAVTSRTLGGRTIPFESLSGGAREQLCVLKLLACAMLVSPAEADGGVPVIIDDALGYSDPSRLALLGAAFNSAAESCQVIILTCFPERYEHVGSAAVEKLTPGPRLAGNPSRKGS